MVFHFNIDYKTVYGEELVLNMTVDGKEVQYKMGTEDGSRWSFDWDGNIFYRKIKHFFAQKLEKGCAIGCTTLLFNTFTYLLLISYFSLMKETDKAPHISKIPATIIMSL